MESFSSASPRIDRQFGIDIEALAERLLLVEHAVAGEEGAVLHADDIHGLSVRTLRACCASIASATASASTLIATSWTRNSAAPLSRRMTLVAAVPDVARGRLAAGDVPMKRLREVPAISGKPSA